LPTALIAQAGQRLDDLARRYLGRLQAVRGAQQHHVLERELVFVARPAARRHETGIDQPRHRGRRQAEHVAHALQ
jgi:hypothetical protein